MIRQRKASIVRVRRYQRSLDNNRIYSSIKKKRPNTAVHITIGSSRQIRPTKNNLHSISDTERKKSITTNKSPEHFVSVTNINRQHHSRLQLNGNIIGSDSSTKRSSLRTNDTANTSHHSKHSRTTHYENATTGYSTSIKDRSDQKGMTQDYHRKSKKNKKTKCSRRCIIMSLLITALLILIVATILLVLLIKPKQVITPTNMPVLRWNSTGVTVAGISGNASSGSNYLNRPFDVTLDYANNLYIADRYNNRIQKYLFGTTNITTVAGDGTLGPSSYQLHYPSRVIFDSNGNLLVTDSANHRIQLWPSGGISGTTIAGVTYSPGNSSTQLNTPYGIVLNPISGTLYISDSMNHRVVSYASGANSSTLLLGGNGAGASNIQLNNPVGLHFDSFTNSLIIANFGGNNIVQYVLGANNWTLLAGDINGVSGMTSTTLNAPTQAVFDPMGNMYVADRNNHRVQFFYKGQLNGTTIAGVTSTSGSSATTLNTPWSLKLDNQLNLYVTDTLNHRIQKFSRY
ncbi:unnamed protein product [Adineta steineri]|uniref:NHL repeat containing protein n=2 Tax=Adineta steineri TaxID=433720 RepID=A0A818I942_9BILA|nr:unnamed protein product [Adineta steineri]